MHLNDYMTTSEAARTLKRSRRRITQMIAAGILTAIRPGREWLISRESVAAYQANPAPPQGGRRRGTRACPRCRGIARTRADRKMVWGRYVWECQDCGVQHIVYMHSVRILEEKE
ncbi:MAG: excisionase family DNA-binding protein [Armatimonadetes bacterium]|nr:excisionase family DNA-binding protein [Armatimonadota bacterium]NIM24110.1 excisionase family DNA-binding protein [Armatimonadota bacterium]NIM67965.1 excisionase family DNA-binding protein [Armatimonadota bacterium]NIN06194.1 excisionase family DNA-binding protein [Armatimonadota bacterium]NIO97633.1 excisionase family DNA-binding protein [Armatimonadota bacterium]